jgi:hypothetical protein
LHHGQLGVDPDDIADLLNTYPDAVTDLREEHGAITGTAELVRSRDDRGGEAVSAFPSLLDVGVHRDPARYRQELEQVLLTGWYPAAPSCDLAEPGDQVVGEQLEEPVVIARTEDGLGSARHGVRQRRETKLAAGSDSRGPGTVYNMHDRGTNAPGVLVRLHRIMAALMFTIAALG